ncbi:MAG TPA: TetR/AcrR family transcriptional regulator [Terriglobales bacterium]|nr:TetR/AcrR family transcriptional regulator [Terriglobales bacterium]
MPLPPADRSGSAEKPEGTGRRGRRGDPAAKREALLEAALTVFLAEGYSAARLDDIAAAAGVAKGTIYLQFKDKEDLFRALILERMAPLLTEAEALAGNFTGTTRELLKMLSQRMRQELLATRRKDLLRLVISEAPRFPWLAEFHYRNVVSRGVGMVRMIAKRGVERGELASDALVRFPQLLPPSMLTAVIWTTVFNRFEPLDADAFIDTHLELLLRALETPAASARPERSGT